MEYAEHSVNKEQPILPLQSNNKKIYVHIFRFICKAEQAVPALTPL